MSQFKVLGKFMHSTQIELQEGHESTIIRLERCPFCGGQAQLESVPGGTDYRGIICTGCGAGMRIKKDSRHTDRELYTELSAKWNKRINK